MKYNRLAFLATSLALLSACAPDPLGPPRDVAHFKAHPDERADVLGKCNADPGQLGQRPNCVNARQAQWDATLKADDNSVPRLPPAN